MEGIVGSMEVRGKGTAISSLLGLLQRGWVVIVVVSPGRQTVGQRINSFKKIFVEY